MRRPGWPTLPEKLQPGDVVVVPRIDRLARNLTEGLRTIEELHAQGIHIRSLAEGPGHRRRQPHVPGSCCTCCSPWPSGSGRPSGTGSRAGVDRAAAEGRTGGRPPALDFEKVQAVRDFLANNNGNVSAAHRTFKVSRAVIRAVRDGTYKGLDKLHQNNA